MGREFTKNMFIMLLAIMIGVILITFFASDIMKRMELQQQQEQYQAEIEIIETEKIIIEEMSKNFTDHFFKSLGYLDLSREYRADGNTNFDFAASIWYPQKEYDLVIENCSQAMEKLFTAYENFLESKTFFADIEEFTTDEKYLSIINLYVDLCDAGANVSMLRYNASYYLKDIATKLRDFGESANVSELLVLYNTTIALYQGALGQYEAIIDEIEEEFGKFFNPIRETP